MERPNSQAVGSVYTPAEGREGSDAKTGGQQPLQCDTLCRPRGPGLATTGQESNTRPSRKRRRRRRRPRRRARRRRPPPAITYCCTRAPARTASPLHALHQRATEVYLHERGGHPPARDPGQGMGPLTARAAHLVRALAGAYTLNQNLLEVYPKATIWKLFGRTPRASYKRHHAQQEVRLIRDPRGAPGLSSAPASGASSACRTTTCSTPWICAYTAWLWARDGGAPRTRPRSVRQRRLDLVPARPAPAAQGDIENVPTWFPLAWS